MNLPPGLSTHEYFERREQLLTEKPLLRYLPPEEIALLVFITFDYRQEEIADCLEVHQSTISKKIKNVVKSCIKIASHKII